MVMEEVGVVVAHHQVESFPLALPTQQAGAKAKDHPRESSPLAPLKQIRLATQR